MHRHLIAYPLALLLTTGACTDVPDLGARLLLEVHADPASNPPPDTVRISLRDASGLSLPKNADDPA